jgi:hypothetical protein
LGLEKFQQLILAREYCGRPTSQYNRLPCYLRAGLAGAACSSGRTIQVFLSREAGESTLEFRVRWEIEVDADGPREAAEAARAEQQRETSATVFDVWEYAGKKMYRIDVAECLDKLDGDELGAIRTHLRLLQCVPGVPASVGYMASAMLIFLDREKMMFRKDVGLV